MHLDYKTEIEKVYQALGESQLMVLASSSQNHTTARMMSCVIYDGKIAFQTSTELHKFKQITDNPRVALCINNISIEGIANIIGHPLEDQCKSFTDLYKKHHASSYEKYSPIKSNRLIEVTPQLITLWVYENGEPFRLFIDMQNETASMEPYDCADRYHDGVIHD